MSEFDIKPGERVRLIAMVAGSMSVPNIVDGRASSSGKTVIVDESESDAFKKGFRLDREKLETGDSVKSSGSPWQFMVYTPRRYQSSQGANLAPGPQQGANHVSSIEELPTPTHRK